MCICVNLKIYLSLKLDDKKIFSTLDMLSSLVAVIPLENILFIQKFKCICVNLKLNLASS